MYLSKHQFRLNKLLHINVQIQKTNQVLIHLRYIDLVLVWRAHYKLDQELDASDVLALDSKIQRGLIVEIF